MTTISTEELRWKLTVARTILDMSMDTFCEKYAYQNKPGVYTYLSGKKKRPNQKINQAIEVVWQEAMDYLNSYNNK